jgi:hypothetical protein
MWSVRGRGTIRKAIQMAKDKRQMANSKPFEFCHLPFAI